MQEAIDFFAVGDIVIDAFIRLKDAEVHCDVNHENCMISMRWGDKIPYDFHQVVPAVGNSANAAVAAARLGLKSALRAYVGNDTFATQCFAALEIDKVNTEYMEKVSGKNTNYHYVLWYEAQRTILVKHETFDYALPKLEVPPKWLYLSSLGENSLPYHNAWAGYLAEHPEVKLAFQPGTYQIQFSKDQDWWDNHTTQFEALYKRSHIFFCNKEEAERILKLPAGQDMKELLKKMQELGPKNVVITDDVRGAYAIEESGKMLFVPRYPDPRPPYEITGAGDAFASATTVALVLEKPLGEALKWGATNASAVLQSIGAQKGLLTREQLEHNLANPPAPFEIQEL